MTKFALSDFDMGSGSERYVTYGPNRDFIARFKYMRPAANAKHFVKFLIANFTVEEYAAARAAGKAPAEILREKGYVSLNEANAAKRRAAAEAERTAVWTIIPATAA
ncbi:MAG: hypothetical protein DI537_40640 [Stutzerimonas stutzeri]|nr:MAG: hypothetical protein DI537_40640 [Stutzerimonas stutzeri]